MELTLADEAVLFYEQVGDRGPPLIAVHGGFGLDHTYLRPGLDALASRVQVVYPDVRGNGRSDCPRSYQSITLERLARDLDAIRASLGIERVVIFGHSMGAAVALEYAVQTPDHVAGLILCGGAAALDHAPEAFAGVQPRMTAEQSAFFAEPPTDPDAFKDAYLKVLPLYFRRWNPAFGAYVDAHMQCRPAAMMHTFAQLAPALDLRNRLGGVLSPTLILCGAHDWLMPVTPCGQELNDGIAASEMVVFEESGHYPFVEEKDRFLDVVSSWLGRIADSRGGES